MVDLTPGQAGEVCSQCTEKAARWHALQEKRLARGQEEFDRVMALGAVKRVTEHAHRRYLDRALSAAQVEKALEDGVVIECQKNQGHTNLVVFSALKLGRGKYRPLHIVIEALPWLIKIITVYDPRSQQWRWDESCTRRVCWCKNRQEKV